MGLFTSLCKNCDEELDWFLEVKGGITCKKCGTHNTEKDVKESLIGNPFYEKREFMIKERKKIRERRLKIDKLKKSI